MLTPVHTHTHSHTHTHTHTHAHTHTHILTHAHTHLRSRVSEWADSSAAALLLAPWSRASAPSALSYRLIVILQLVRPEPLVSAPAAKALNVPWAPLRLNSLVSREAAVGLVQPWPCAEGGWGGRMRREDEEGAEGPHSDTQQEETHVVHQGKPEILSF